MQVKKSQDSFIRNIIESTNDIVFCKKIETELGYKEFYNLLGNPGQQLVFEKRKTHRYWKFIDRSDD